MTDRIEELLSRIESLERRNRRIVGAGVAVLALGAVGLVSARAVCDTVTAERFVLRDAQGQQRGVFTAYETGGAPQFSLLDKKGKPMATIGVEKDGAFLTLTDATGEHKVRYGVGAGGAATTDPSGCDKKSCDKKDDAIGMATN